MVRNDQEAIMQTSECLSRGDPSHCVSGPKELYKADGSTRSTGEAIPGDHDWLNAHAGPRHP